MNYCEITTNPGVAPLKDIPFLNYHEFIEQAKDLLHKPVIHCVNYFVHKTRRKLQFYIVLANDSTHSIYVFAHEQADSVKKLESLTALHYPMHIFEREIFENYGVEFENHPWLKPLRYPENRFDRELQIKDYPFYKIESDELHEVGVGPIHAGIIEPGHFRFICNGEDILHLEIQLGYQHRGIEKLFLQKKHLLQQSVLADSISGDSSVGHGLAFVQLIEALSDTDISPHLQIERCIALEMERIAMHIGDTAALCGDVAYQFGQVTCEALRTLVINAMQDWCGNRFAKGLIRPGGTNYPLSARTIEILSYTLFDACKRFMEVANHIYNYQGILARFERTGTLSTRQIELTGAVGMAARSTGVNRDIRASQPFQYFRILPYEPVLLDSGDVYARGLLRKKEVEKSYIIIKKLIHELKNTEPFPAAKPDYNLLLRPESLGVSLTEGWRGEICHSCISGKAGNMKLYKIKDPSLHNWLALSLAVREQEISDFPVCNKSFNLSYCGNDL
jgi:Ni,Fe-hydrogenase III large subunit/NADH:ubiquinone oxidoreductase subunit C